MSDLYKSAARSKLAKLPLDFPPMIDHDDDSSSTSSTGTVVPSPTRHLFSRTDRGPSSLVPLPWTDFFAQELFLTVLDPAHSDVTITYHAYITPSTDSGPLFVMHHGAGSSGLTFAACATEIRKIIPNAGILSPDCRGHGNTTIASGSDKDEEAGIDFSLQTLSRDLLSVIQETKTRMRWENLPDIILVGHSLGGAVVTHAAHTGALGAKLLAYAVLDIVEGSAMDALQSMDKYLATRPTRFPSLSSGIEWHFRSRTIRNRTSARISVPSLLCEDLTQNDPSRPWAWRTDLAKTKPFWENWFTGLSKKFLEARGGKLLMLAGTDRLDKELMIGQMQGKYQLQVFPEAGHFIQEDLPVKTAEVLADFFKRNDRGALVLPPKVADMQASAAMKKSTGAGVVPHIQK